MLTAVTAATLQEGQRHLPLDGTYNVRDVGGYPTRDGRLTRWRTLLRADSLHRLSPRAQADLLAYGVRTIVDLRRPGELMVAPNVFVGVTAVRYLHLPLIGEDPVARSAERLATLPETYRWILDNRQATIRDALLLIAEDDGLPALFHCTAGKDRTGLMVALLLSLVDVADGTIAKDYALTSTYLGDAYFEEARERAERAGIPWDHYREHLVCPAEFMLETLEYLRDRYGSAEQYLLGAGVPAEALASLRQRLVQDPA